MRSNTLGLARGGIFVALSLMLLYLSTIVPINKLFMLGMASVIIPISIISTGIKNTIIVYVSTSILSVLLLGFKGNVIGYILFFGLYGFIKLYIEKISNLFIEIPLKLIYFSISMYIIYLISKLLIVEIPTSSLPLSLLIFAVELIFLVCDYALSMVISYADTHLLKKMRLFNK